MQIFPLFFIYSKFYLYFDFVEETLVRKNPNKFGFSLTYSYLCIQLLALRLSGGGWYDFSGNINKRLLLFGIASRT
jgi:hypothetical protein